MKIHGVEVWDFPWKLGLGHWSSPGLEGGCPNAAGCGREAVCAPPFTLESNAYSEDVQGTCGVELTHAHTPLTPNKSVFSS